MDDSNIKKFVNVPKVDELKTDNITLSDESSKKVEQFIDNNITMANNWIGAAGDGFLFSANTLATFLVFTMEFFDANQDLLGNYKLTFQDIDDQLAEIENLELN